MRLIYPLLWSRPGREADREQTVNTAGALARAGAEVTLLMPRGRNDPEVRADDLRALFDVTGDFRLIQRPSRWGGEHVVPSYFWLRQAFKDPETAGSDVFYSRMPVAFGRGAESPIPFAVEHYRPWPDRIPPLRPLFRRTSLAEHCLGFILHSRFAADSFARIGVPEEKLLVAHNGAEPGRMLPRLTKAEARAALGLPQDRPIAVYAGRVNARKGLDQILILARLRPETLFLLVGSEGEGEIEREALALANVRIFPWQSPASLPPFLYAADILLIPPSLAPLEQFGDCVLPMKTFAYLAAGRAILAPVAPDTAELLRDGDNALLVPPGNPDAAAAALDRLVHDTALADALGANAAALAQSLSWDARARRILDFLEAGLSRRG
ncbi:MAG TPA: glycosyltransferase [Allosphingosinicella sp.]|jgi:glycosyltransferase involved in cell wall biosynthesis